MDKTQALQDIHTYDPGVSTPQRRILAANMAASKSPKQGRAAVTAAEATYGINSGTLTAATITVNAKTKTADQADPIFDAVVAGFDRADMISVSFAVVAHAAQLVGTYQITATVNDPLGRLSKYTVTNTPANLTITPGAATKLAFGQQPTAVVRPASITPAVTVLVQDAFGNTVTSSTASVTMALTTGPGVLTGGGATAAVAGIATFSGLQFSLAGAGDILTASSAGLTSIASNAFNVT